MGAHAPLAEGVMPSTIGRSVSTFQEAAPGLPLRHSFLRPGLRPQDGFLKVWENAPTIGTEPLREDKSSVPSLGFTALVEYV